MSDQRNGSSTVERRRTHRQRVLKGAVIVFGGLGRVFDCQVRDLSEHGAKLSLASTVGVPDEFELLLTGNARIAPAKVVWRNDRALGVEFTGPWRDHSGSAG